MFLPILTLVIGGIFGYAGVAILFFNRYDIIADYTPHDGPEYARRVGIVELAGGILHLAGGAVGLCLQNDTVSWFVLLGCIAFTLAGLSLAKKR